MDVSIVIVNHNTRDLLSACIDSIYRNTFGCTFEIIVVDNASTDESETCIKEHYPLVIWINTGANLGFGRANNRGVQSATGKYIFLLNSDTILCNDAISIFFIYAEEHSDEKIGILGSWLLNRAHHINASYGEFPSPKSEITYLFGKLRSEKESISELVDRNVDYIIGADMFLRKDLFLQYRGFDPNFFMYYEETDLQYRMAKAGYIRRIITGPQIIHLEGGSFGSNGLTLNRFMMAQRSYNYYLKKHFRGIKYLYHKGALCMMRLTVFLAKNWSFKDKINAYCEVWK